MSKKTKITLFKSFFAAACVAAGTNLSNNVANQFISPIIFTVGILLVIALKLELITRSVPVGDGIKHCLIVLLGNFAASGLLGVIMGPFMDIPAMATGWDCLLRGMGTGIVIGLVCLVNLKQAPYKELITMILMYAFVWLKLPHCVVYAIYLAAAPSWAGLASLGIAIAGNVIGGSVVRAYIGLEKIVIKPEENAA